MSTFTVFFCGTGSNHTDYLHNNYYEGELVSTLARNHAGLEYDDWLIADGPGSGNLQEKDKWTAPGNYSNARGTATGAGWEENVKQAIAVIKKTPTHARARHTGQEARILSDAGIHPEGGGRSLASFGAHQEAPRKVTPQALQQKRAQVMNRPLPTKVNLIGWSRGAVTCHMMANAMLADPALSGIPVNIFAVDPVPGAGNFQANRTSVGRNVQNYMAVYAKNERSKGFVPTVPTVNCTGTCHMMVFPGKHATLAGNAFADGGSAGEQIYSGPGRVVRHLADTFLRANGTSFTTPHDLSYFEILENYEQMLRNAAGFTAMNDNTYTYKEESGGERLVGVGGNWLNTRLSATRQLSPDDIFINWHHRNTWINEFGTQRRAPTDARKRYLAGKLPLTSQLVFGG